MEHSFRSWLLSIFTHLASMKGYYYGNHYRGDLRHDPGYPADSFSAVDFWVQPAHRGRADTHPADHHRNPGDFVAAGRDIGLLAHEAPHRQDRACRQDAQRVLGVSLEPGRR